ncbi:hypothetical protein PISMIDRAFT_670728 [Pisolithus microcarpus 441]|uniref:Uncharacterized protein n=1 Tax=Pisolithus microcarpus 441 TaxID=765257 RepID=A0A0C9ZMH8_9AGAM|nr:hypothetical protein PISMIDRAFT_670728 [Pisolithus microcarpus 441]
MQLTSEYTYADETQEDFGRVLQHRRNGSLQTVLKPLPYDEPFLGRSYDACCEDGERRRERLCGSDGKPLCTLTRSAMDASERRSASRWEVGSEYDSPQTGVVGPSWTAVERSPKNVARLSIRRS